MHQYLHSLVSCSLSWGEGWGWITTHALKATFILSSLSQKIVQRAREMARNVLSFIFPFSHRDVQYSGVICNRQVRFSNLVTFCYKLLNILLHYQWLHTVLPSFRTVCNIFNKVSGAEYFLRSRWSLSSSINSSLFINYFSDKNMPVVPIMMQINLVHILIVFP